MVDARRDAAEATGRVATAGVGMGNEDFAKNGNCAYISVLCCEP